MKTETMPNRVKAVFPRIVPASAPRDSVLINALYDNQCPFSARDLNAVARRGAIDDNLRRALWHKVTDEFGRQMMAAMPDVEEINRLAEVADILYPQTRLGPLPRLSRHEGQSFQRAWWSMQGLDEYSRWNPPDLLRAWDPVQQSFDFFALGRRKLSA